MPSSRHERAAVTLYGRERVQDARIIEVKVPDIGDFSDVPIIEIMVAPGDTVAEADPLVTIESDKATMDVPSPAAGTIRELKVAIGDTVSEGTVLLILDGAAAEVSGASAGGDATQKEQVEPLGEAIAADPGPATGCHVGDRDQRGPLRRGRPVRLRLAAT
jgi:pyruvate/2-oxoglutarate dehydrogenase complex dihydrolipoamide acyltransferase (E2) component